MGRIDEQKELIGALKVYLGFVLAILLSTGTGVSRLYGNGETGILFWLGIVILICGIIVFVLVSRKMHKLISELKDL